MQNSCKPQKQRGRLSGSSKVEHLLYPCTAIGGKEVAQNLVALLDAIRASFLYIHAHLRECCCHCPHHLHCFRGGGCDSVVRVKCHTQIFEVNCMWIVEWHSHCCWIVPIYSRNDGEGQGQVFHKPRHCAS